MAVRFQSRGDAGPSSRPAIELSGEFRLGQVAAELAFPPEQKLAGETVVLLDAGITAWDSSLLAAVTRIKAQLEKAGATADYSALPPGVVRMLDLALAIPEREGSRREQVTDPFFARIGKSFIASVDQFFVVMQFIGEAVLGLGRLFTGRARYRHADLWLVMEQCGPQALGIITTISLLVGAILAFVGSIQLKMFGAEIYVANLVGLGMVMEMGALMTGIILAGRTGASFAAQLGTMQVNEEIDALTTMGIPPMDYLVLPRMVALALMTPLLVIYSDVLGIIGGGVVGVLLLKMSPAVYFNQTIEMMTLWYCAQGLIKGSTFGVLIAFCGCFHGIQCGRSASAVGKAATTAVVSSIVAIVIADAVWTFLFMLIE